MKEKKQKYERKKEVDDKTRNNNFAAALDNLKRQSKEKLYQKDLAKMLGVAENTISNIINYRTVVSEDMITLLQTKSGCVFNLQWLRGQSDVMLAADLASAPTTSAPADPTTTALLAAKDETIAELRARLNDKDSQLADRERTIASKNEVIAGLKRELALKDESIATLRS